MPSATHLDLDGYVALISGGGTGIGEAIARAFVGAGAAVVITGRRREVLEAAAAAIASEGGGRRVVAIAGDVAKRADSERMVAGTVAAFGRLDVLVNNAGVSRGGPLGAMQESAVHEVVDVDLKGPVFLTQAALAHLTAAGKGRASILNISSSVTVHPVPNYSVYSAAKAGLDMLTRCWAIELAPARIRVNAILPGIVRTPVFATMLPADAIERHLERFEKLTPLGRVGEPEDVARLALFLSSPASEWTTGAVIPLDGGLSLVSEA